MDKPQYKTSPIKAIRAKCLDCSSDDKIEVRECPIIDCPIWPYRMGKNPYNARTKNMSTEQKQVFADRMKKAWETRRANLAKKEEEECV